MGVSQGYPAPFIPPSSLFSPKMWNGLMISSIIDSFLCLETVLAAGVPGPSASAISPATARLSEEAEESSRNSMRTHHDRFEAQAIFDKRYLLSRK